ncbi:MoaF-related domain-containing protein [Aquicella lusitana]|uniref:MoaF-like domain-containing protein n=1 Tax=Aquicella lusitana TaxID=254246 RepID=A0A370GDA2_9COXI|nr:MoaF C-terminal domain-containing protein [Aquicella lusitana]RDI39943.1 hypothetical protein C8D86_1254 [Aquicella lusitana]VVC74546.1 hypothetical protein AQULUS_23120 [Aquicella lusitana]
MKRKIAFAAFIFAFFATSSVAAAPKVEHYIFKYESDRAFDVKLTDNTITWQSLSGPDKGQTETDFINRKKLSKNIEIVQWAENDGTFVTVILDRAQLNVISSGKFSTGTWLWSGKAIAV